ncbi:hypothetical protein HDU76_009803 [Blyttiomyces sp. JEL0837]|nr:hypothetical protein HDU76_009803 [Blyttiomyces sp. JEL0837]
MVHNRPFANLLDSERSEVKSTKFVRVSTEEQVSDAGVVAKERAEGLATVIGGLGGSDEIEYEEESESESENEDAEQGDDLQEDSSNTYPTFTLIERNGNKWSRDSKSGIVLMTRPDGVSVQKTCADLKMAFNSEIDGDIASSSKTLSSTAESTGEEVPVRKDYCSIL